MSRRYDQIPHRLRYQTAEHPTQPELETNTNMSITTRRNKLPFLHKRLVIAEVFGHLARMDETAGARRILTGVHQSDWSRPVGRPYTSWMATLKSDLSLHNLTFKDAIELALDKSLWRLLVASGATH